MNFELSKNTVPANKSDIKVPLKLLPPVFTVKAIKGLYYYETILSIPQCAITDDILAHEFSELAEEQMLTGSDGEICYVPGHEEEDHHHDDEDDHDDHDEDSDHDNQLDHHDDLDHGSGSGSGAKGEYIINFSI